MGRVPLVNGLLDPRSMGMLGAAGGLLQASGATRLPVTMGQALGQGLQGGLLGYQQGHQLQQQDQLFGLKMQRMRDSEAAQQQQQGYLDQIAQTLPPEQRPMFFSDPKGFMERKVVAPGGALVSGFGPQFQNPPAAPKPSFEMSDMTPEQARQFLLKKSKAGASTNTLTVPVTVGTREADKKFAEDYVPFITGGYTDTIKQLDQLKAAAQSLQVEPDGSITGPKVGVLPRSALAVLNPKAAATMDNVEEVVQRNLRLILGAQFTEKEGERLIARSYNAYLPQAENAKRLNRLIQQIQTAAEAKLEAAKYFQQHGSLQGFKGKIWTMSDFNPESGGDKPKVNLSPEVLDFLKKNNIEVP